MSYELKKPYTDTQKANFIVEYNYEKGLRITETEEALYALEPNENIENGVPVINPDYEEEQAQEREALFKRDFFNIKGFGWYRKQPKGYQSAVESINTAFNIVATLGTLPAGSLIFYTAPDFSDPEQTTEEWLVANQIKSEEMTTEQFGQFYAAFIQAWNTQEHL